MTALDMIRYALRCADGHAFESWFRDSRLVRRTAREAGWLSCPACGVEQVDKALMAPAVVTSRRKRSHATVPTERPDACSGSRARAVARATRPRALMRAMLREMRDHLVHNSHDVGAAFADEARRIHEGTVGARRAIHGSPRTTRSGRCSTTASKSCRSRSFPTTGTEQLDGVSSRQAEPAPAVPGFLPDRGGVSNDRARDQVRSERLVELLKKVRIAMLSTRGTRRPLPQPADGDERRRVRRLALLPDRRAVRQGPRPRDGSRGDRHLRGRRQADLPRPARHAARSSTTRRAIKAHWTARRGAGSRRAPKIPNSP